MTESATGLILRVRSLTDTSLIIQWLTPSLGRLATVAKGARRAKSPFAGRLDLFYRAEFSFQRSRRSELHQLREVSLLETHAAIRGDITLLQQASYAAVMIEQATEEETPIPEIYDLAKGLFEHLASTAPQPQTVFAFEVKLLNALGLQPDSSQENLGPDITKVLDMLLRGGWPSVARLKLSPNQFTRLNRFLETFLVFHLGRVPRNRANAVAT